MNRIQKYKESLYKFLQTKSCLNELITNENNLISEFIYEKIKSDDLMFPILLLTIMNSQNKKYHLSMQGYYIAICVEFIIVLSDIITDAEYSKHKLGEKYSGSINVLILAAIKSLQQNMESIKNTYQAQPQNLVNIMINSLEFINTTISTVTNLEYFVVQPTDNKCNNDIINWFIKDDNPDMIFKFKNLKQIDPVVMQEYINRKYLSIAELSIKLGWMIGGGNIKPIGKIKKMAKYFSMMYKISKDFENLSDNINSDKGYSLNYVVNYGMQNSYEVFLSSKEKFIEELMNGEAYTSTIKEIIDNIEEKIDIIIDQSSPDLKSSYSSKK